MLLRFINSTSRRFCPAAVYFISIAMSSAQAPLEWLDEKLTYQTPDAFLKADLSGLFDVEGYYIDQRPPGLIFGNNDEFLNPRLSLFLDVQIGPKLYSLTQVRFDRGFDPRSEVRDGRFDEYLLRYTPWDDGRVNLQVGKFATVFGNWVARHDSWHNPFINAPLPYENVTVVTDGVVPGGSAGFLGRRNVADNKPGWLPVIWGPAYTTGASVFGRWDRFEYAAEVKNNAVSSRPRGWHATEVGFEHPSYTARLGYVPNAAWRFGGSASHGAYLQPAAERVAAFPVGYDRGSFNQTTLGWDLAYAHHHWEIWAEAILSRFQVPNVGNADSFSYYVEAKYKITPQMFGGVRWGQQLFDTVPAGGGGTQHWDRNIWRMEGALGYRFTRNLQGKVQYGYSHQAGPFQQGEQLLAGQVTLRF